MEGASTVCAGACSARMGGWLSIQEPHQQGVKVLAGVERHYISIQENQKLFIQLEFAAHSFLGFSTVKNLELLPGLVCDGEQ